MDVKELSELKQGHRTMWDSGDYASVAERYVEEVGERLVEQAAPGRGEELLDVAAGSGNVAIPAARKGARVTALDLAPSSESTPMRVVKQLVRASAKHLARAIKQLGGT